MSQLKTAPEIAASGIHVEEPNATALSPSSVRVRFGLAAFLVGAWLLLAAFGQLLFNTIRYDYDIRYTDLFYVNSVGFTHALLFAMVLVACTFPWRVSPWIVGCVTAAVILMTIAVSRIGYPFNMVDTFQSMFVRSFLFMMLLLKLVTARRLEARETQFSPSATARLQLTMLDVLMVMLILATFLAIIRTSFGYFPRVVRIDLRFANGDPASFVLFTFEALLESGIGLLWVYFLSRPPRVIIALPTIYLATLICSVLGTLASKLYGWFQFGVPLNLHVAADLFQTALPSLLAFTTWLMLFCWLLRWIGALPSTIWPASSLQSELLPHGSRANLPVS